jgi:hypothetical protein
MSRYSDRLNIKGNEPVTDSRSIFGWMIIRKTRPILIQAELPIFWRKSTAVRENQKHKGTIVKVQVHYRLPFMQALPKDVVKSILSCGG